MLQPQSAVAHASANAPGVLDAAAGAEGDNAMLDGAVEEDAEDAEDDDAIARRESKRNIVLMRQLG